MSVTLERVEQTGFDGGGLPPINNGGDNGDNWGGGDRSPCAQCPWLRMTVLKQTEILAGILDDKIEPSTETPLATEDTQRNITDEAEAIRMRKACSKPVMQALAAARLTDCDGPIKEKEYVVKIPLIKKVFPYGQMVVRCTNSAVPLNPFRNGYPGRKSLIYGVPKDDTDRE
jgi:hypothetical protein